MALVSVLVLNYNGGPFIENCLNSVLSQTRPLTEILVIDNASSDGSPDMVGTRFPNVEILRTGANLGFAGGMNAGIRRAKGDILVLLNPDVVLENDFIGTLVDTVEREPLIGSASGKVYRLPADGPPVIDTTGHVIFNNRLFTDRGEDQIDQGQYDRGGEVFGVCAGVGVYKKEMLEDIKEGDEYFDESFFLFLEDTDLNWRAQLRGWKCEYVPSAVAWHHRGGTATRRTKLVELHNYKNRYMMLIKNDSAFGILRNFHHFVITDTIKSVALLGRCPPALLGWFDVWRELPSLMRKRRVIQKNRTVSRAEFERWFAPFEYGRWIRRHIKGT